MAAPWQGLPVRLERAPHRGAASAIGQRLKRAKIGHSGRSPHENGSPSAVLLCRKSAQKLTFISSLLAAIGDAFKFAHTA